MATLDLTYSGYNNGSWANGTALWQKTNGESWSARGAADNAYAGWNGSNNYAALLKFTVPSAAQGTDSGRSLTFNLPGIRFASTSGTVNIDYYICSAMPSTAAGTAPEYSVYHGYFRHEYTASVSWVTITASGLSAASLPALKNGGDIYLWLGSTDHKHNGLDSCFQAYLGTENRPTGTQTYTATYTLTLKKTNGVSSFVIQGTSNTTGTAAPGAGLNATATAATGYHLTKYEGTLSTGSGTSSWTSCAGLSSHTTGWVLNGDRAITVYAEANQYTLTANPNGGKLAGANFGANDGTTNSASVTVIYGSTSYRWLGTASKDNITSSCTVTFDANGGSCSTSTLTSSRTTSYTFSGWYTGSNSNGTKVFYADGSAIPSTSYWNASKQWCYTGDLTVYAGYISSTGDYSAITLPIATRTGYDFKGWAISNTATSGDTGDYTPTGNTTLYAIWAAKTYTVSYNANGGNGSMDDSTATYGKNFITRQNTFTKSGCVFNGWNEKSDGTGTVWGLTTSGVYESGKPWAWTYTKNITLYAQWTTDAVRIEVNSQWKTGQAYVFVNGTWKPGAVYCYTNGQWKKST